MAGIGAVAVLASVLSGCSGADGSSRGDSVRVDSMSAFTYTGPDGLLVSGAAGVAVPETLVRITPNQHALAGLSDELTYLGRSVDIVLGDGEQPRAPIRVTIPLPAAAADATDRVVAVTEHEGAREFVEVKVNEDATISATLTHLSVLDFFLVDMAKFAGKVTDSLRTLVTGESSRAPECLEKPVQVEGVTYTANRAKNDSGGNLDAVWPCLRWANGTIALDLESNGRRAWLARSQPEVGNGVLSAPDSGDAAAAGFFQLFYNLGRHRSTGTLMPGTTLTFAFTPDKPPTRAEVRVDAGLMLTAALVYEITAILDLSGATTADNLDKVPGAYDCLLAAADTLDRSAKNVTDNVASAFTTIVGCMAAVAPGPLAFLLNIVGTGAGLVAGFLTAVWGELSQNNHGVITIDRTGAATGDYALTWTGHTRQMHLRPDHTGDITIFSGASDGETWSATWKTGANGISVTLQSMTTRTGAGLTSMKPGLTWNAELQRPDGRITVLHFVDPGQNIQDQNQGFFWCADKYGYSSMCGA